MLILTSSQVYLSRIWEMSVANPSLPYRMMISPSIALQPFFSSLDRDWKEQIAPQMDIWQGTVFSIALLFVEGIMRVSGTPPQNQLFIVSEGRMLTFKWCWDSSKNEMKPSCSHFQRTPPAWTQPCQTCYSIIVYMYMFFEIINIYIFSYSDCSPILNKSIESRSG